MNASIRTLLLSIGLVAGAFAVAQVPPVGSGEAVVYPSRGQDAKQQDVDRYQCFDWARGQSGFDPTRSSTYTPAPAAPATTAPTTPTTSTRSTDPTGGMARGAMGGAAIGELSHNDVGKAAAAGALGGGLMSRMKEQQQQQAKAQQTQATQAQAQMAQQQALQQQMAGRNQQKATYDRAFGACMEGRGYTVR